MLVDTRAQKSYVAAIGLLLGVLYFSVFVELVGDWAHDENYSHGFLVPLVAAFLVWRKRKRLRSMVCSPNNWGMVVLISGLGLLMVATIGAEYFTTRFSLLVVVAGLLLYLWGSEALRELAFPLVYLVFMIPIPYVVYYSFSFPLKLFASRCTAPVIRLLGVPVVREGNILHLPNLALEVVDACSGLRSLISLLALGALFAYLTQEVAWKRWVLFLFTVPVAIGANVFRLTATAVLAQIYGEEAAMGFLHQFSGMLVFAFAVVLLVLAGRVLRWKRMSSGIGSP